MKRKIGNPLTPQELGETFERYMVYLPYLLWKAGRNVTISDDDMEEFESLGRWRFYEIFHEDGTTTLTYGPDDQDPNLPVGVIYESFGGKG